MVCTALACRAVVHVIAHRSPAGARRGLPAPQLQPASRLFHVLLPAAPEQLAAGVQRCRSTPATAPSGVVRLQSSRRASAPSLYQASSAQTPGSILVPASS